jgi:hypothetical protein
MRISSGVSEISFTARPESAIRAEKVYIWPVYADARVERIQGITRRTEGNAVYSKPLPEDQEKLISLMQSPTCHYTGEGRARSHCSLPPGSFFDALV